MCATIRGSTSEMWLMTRMKPPSAGIFSPSIHLCRVVARRIGLTMGTAIHHAQPRLPSWKRRTFTRDRLVVPAGTEPPASMEQMQRYVALVPVKPPALGKSRLVGLADADRRALAAAFALDTVAACMAASTIAAVLVATDDATFSVELAALGAVAIPDGVAMDLNGTLRQSAAEARRRWPELVPVALTADLPAVRGTDLDEALSSITPGEAAYVADSEGLGTTLYTAAHEAFQPRFGPGSALAHDATGARPIGAAHPRLRRDVDDPSDLDAALAMGVGPRTAERA